MNKGRVFKGGDGDWYWQLVAPNGKIVAVGGEGFTERNDAAEAMADAITSFEVDIDPDVPGPTSQDGMEGDMDA